MSSLDDIDSVLNELLPESRESETDPDERATLEGKFQTLSSLGGHLGVYSELTNPSKDDLIAALSDLGVQNAAEDSVYEFLQIDGDSTKGFIRSKRGEWREQNVSEIPNRDLTGNYAEYAKLASFLGLYESYGLDRPSANKLRQVLINFGVRDATNDPNTYLAPVEGEDGTEHLIGIATGEVTTAYPVDGDEHQIGDDEYTSDLLPKLVQRLDSGVDGADGVEQFTPPLPDDVANLLENEQVAETYQLIMNRLAEQAAGDDVPEAIRSKKLAEARFITEVLAGERTWE